MKLFVVNRYGAEESGNDDALQKKRLEDLLKRAQKRKESAVKAESPVKVEGDSPLKQKRRKSKVPEPEEAAPPGIQDLLVEEPAPEAAGLLQEEDVTPQKKKAKIDTDAAQPEGFTVIGRDQFKKVKEVKGIAPKWLAQPTVISVDMKNLDFEIEDLTGLSPVLKKALKEDGKDNIFPVQRELIPWILKEYRNSLTGYWPRDVCVSAPTGSGKTLAFVLPLVQILIGQPVIEVKALVVLPVQDLAKQVFSVFQNYCKNTNVKVALATGQGLIDEEQKNIVAKDHCGNFHPLAHIIVTTPGRLVHHLRDTEGLDLGNLRFLVVDEADRVMDGAQSDWLYHLEKHIARSRNDGDCSKKVLGQVPPLSIFTLKNQRPPPQKLLFSATLSQDPEKLARLALFQPKLFTCVVKPRKQTGEKEEVQETDFVGHYSMPAEIKESYVLCEDEGAKPLLLHCLLAKRAEKLSKKKGHSCKTLCFASSRLATHRLSLLLIKLSEMSDSKLKVAEISAGQRLMERNAILNRFANGEIDVIVSSDALARGIDIPSVDCVISYDVPEQAKLHVHRVGRTGRAGRKGEAITVLLSQQLPSFQHMLREGAKGSSLKPMKCPEDEMEALEEIYKEALTSVKKIIEEEKQQELILKKKRVGVFGKRKGKPKKIGALKKGKKVLGKKIK